MTNKTVCVTEILNSCAAAIKCPREKFYPDKNFGSQILNASDKMASDELLAYARQAVSEIDGVYVKSADVSGDNAVFTILINDEQRQVSIDL